jgi:uncharacterized protein YjbJ (UPF0337 family)
MNSNRTAGNWEQLAHKVKRRLDKMVDEQLDLWSGKRDRMRPVAEGQVRQPPIEPRK